MRNVGTVVRGIRTQIIKENDDLASIVIDSVMLQIKVKDLDLKTRTLLQYLKETTLW